MKIATLCVPANLPRPHAGATPVPYTSGKIDALEIALTEIVPTVLRGANVVRLIADPGSRFVGQQIIVPYTLAHEGDLQLFDAVSIAVKSLGLKTLMVLTEDGPVEFGVDEIGEVYAL
jgi:hypothetical protein